MTARVVGLEPPLLALGDGSRTVQASVIVGADGLRSTVARAAGVSRARRCRAASASRSTSRPNNRTVHGRLVVIPDGYVGLAPVPGGRVNVGIVLGGRGEADLRGAGAAVVARRVLASVGAPDGSVLDHIAGAAPLAHAVRVRAGRSWVLVGDAAGFLDPLTGEGLHRALVSARLAATAIDDHLSGSSRALADYDRAMRRRFLGKDLVSSLFQAFLAQPVLLRYAVRRLADRPDVRERLELVLADLAPPSRVLDPRVLVRALAP